MSGQIDCCDPVMDSNPRLPDLEYPGITTDESDSEGEDDASVISADDNLDDTQDSERPPDEALTYEEGKEENKGVNGKEESSKKDEKEEAAELVESDAVPKTNNVIEKKNDAAGEPEAVSQENDASGQLPQKETPSTAPTSEPLLSAKGEFGKNLRQGLRKSSGTKEEEAAKSPRPAAEKAPKGPLPGAKEEAAKDPGAKAVARPVKNEQDEQPLRQSPAKEKEKVPKSPSSEPKEASGPVGDVLSGEKAEEDVRLHVVQGCNSFADHIFNDACTYLESADAAIQKNASLLERLKLDEDVLQYLIISAKMMKAAQTPKLLETQGIPAQIQAMEKRVASKGREFPPLVLLKARLLKKFNDFDELIELVDGFLAKVDELEMTGEHLPQFKYPCSSELMKDTKIDNIEKILKRQRGVLTKSRPPPDFRCFLEEFCRTRVDFRRFTGYRSDVDFFGYFQLFCDAENNPCKFEFHPACWKEFDRRHRPAGGSKNQFFANNCPAPHCEGKLGKYIEFDEKFCKVNETCAKPRGRSGPDASKGKQKNMAVELFGKKHESKAQTRASSTSDRSQSRMSEGSASSEQLPAPPEKALCPAAPEDVPIDLPAVPLKKDDDDHELENQGKNKGKKKKKKRQDQEPVVPVDFTHKNPQGFSLRFGSETQWVGQEEDEPKSFADWVDLTEPSYGRPPPPLPTFSPLPPPPLNNEKAKRQEMQNLQDSKPVASFLQELCDYAAVCGAFVSVDSDPWMSAVLKDPSPELVKLMDYYGGILPFLDQTDLFEVDIVSSSFRIADMEGAKLGHRMRDYSFSSDSSGVGSVGSSKQRSPLKELSAFQKMKSNLLHNYPSWSGESEEKTAVTVAPCTTQFNQMSSAEGHFDHNGQEELEDDDSDDYGTTSAAIEELRHELEQSEHERQQANEQLVSAKDDLEKLKNQKNTEIQRLTSEIEELEQEQQKTKAELEVAKKRATDAEKHLAETAEKLKTEKERSKQRKEEHDKALAAKEQAERRVLELKEELRSQSRNDVSPEECEGLRRRAVEAETKVCEIQREVFALNYDKWLTDVSKGLQHIRIVIQRSVASGVEQRSLEQWKAHEVHYESAIETLYRQKDAQTAAWSGLIERVKAGVPLAELPPVEQRFRPPDLSPMPPLPVATASRASPPVEASRPSPAATPPPPGFGAAAFPPTASQNIPSASASAAPPSNQPQPPKKNLDELKEKFVRGFPAEGICGIPDITHEQFVQAVNEVRSRNGGSLRRMGKDEIAKLGLRIIHIQLQTPPPQASSEPQDAATRSIHVSELSDEKVADGCPICFDRFESSQLLDQCRRCSAVYHTFCLKPWIDRNATCPHCRRHMRMDTDFPQL